MTVRRSGRPALARAVWGHFCISCWGIAKESGPVSHVSTIYCSPWCQVWENAVSAPGEILRPISSESTQSTWILKGTSRNSTGTGTINLEISESVSDFEPWLQWINPINLDLERYVWNLHWYRSYQPINLSTWRFPSAYPILSLGFSESTQSTWI